jgi:hypothetical protein
LFAPKSVRQTHFTNVEALIDCFHWKGEKNRTKILKPRIDVMITIFCDFCQVSAKKLAFFTKTDVMIKFLQKTISSLSKKRHFLTKKIGENISKIITLVPSRSQTTKINVAFKNGFF